jgi:hypothetical protein
MLRNSLILVAEIPYVGLYNSRTTEDLLALTAGLT